IEDSIKKEKVPITYEFLSLGNDNWSMVIVNFNLYQISEGDTLSSIAKKFDMPVSQLAKNNGIKDSNQINVGNFLVIR
ncbi:MAG: LysM peptidoglycan-binding domain-containing protein, partial [Clostridia bacterium]